MARRILVAEDSPTQAELVRLLLEQAGYQVDLAANGREGLEKVHTDPPDLIISDVMMPEMDGYAFCQAVKTSEKTRRIPFVLLTQQNAPQHILKGLTCGADNFIPKPFEDKKLLERVAGIFEHLEYRQKGQLEVEVKLRVGDRELVINPDKQQIVELLFATFDDVCRLNNELRVVGRKLEDYALNLEAKVEERTAALRLRGAALDAAANAIVITNREGEILWANPAFALLTGYAVEEVLGQDPRFLKSGRQSAEFFRDLWTTVLDGRVWHGELINRRKDGSLYTEEMTITPVRGQEGAISHFVAIKQDITERKQSEDALRDSEARYRSLFKNMLNGFAYCRIVLEQGQPRDFVYLAVNDAFETLTGLKNVVGKRASEAIPGIRETDPGLFEIYGRVAQSGVPERFETYLKALKMWLAISAYSPSAEHFVVVFDVITARKQAEEALRESEALFRSLFEHHAAVKLLVDPDTGDIVDGNDAAERFYGWPRERLKQMRIQDINTLPPEEVKAEMEQARAQARIHFEFRHRRADGSIRDVEVFSSKITAKGKDLLHSIVHDVSERKRVEREKGALEAQLRQQQKLEAIGTLASGVAHEINNPITGIMNYAQLIADKAEPGSQPAEYAGEILRETDRVATIVRNLLQFARQEEHAHSPARIADIVEQTLSLLRAMFRRDQITLTVDVPEDIPSVKCRSQQIQQVLMNLLTNARDALNERYPGHHEAKTLAVRVAPFEQGGRPWLRLTVADQGLGIPPEIQARIFDPFFTTKPRDKGTGLGLSISHGIVKDHQGVLHFDTDPGTGTRFHLDLPVDNGRTVNGRGDTESRP